MRNLIPTHVGTLTIPVSLNEDGQTAEIDNMCFDPVTDSMFCIIKPAFGLMEIWRALKDGSSSLYCEIPADDISITPTVRDIKVFSETATTVVFQSNGEYRVLSADTEETIEGAIEGSIGDVQWSPDEELVAVAAPDTSSILFLTRDIEVLAELTISPADLKLSKHVSVGWGKRETQFEGKGAKALRDPTMPIKVDNGKSLENDDGRMYLSWRGDGQYLCLSSLDALEEGTRRSIRIISREGVLEGTSEPVDGLQGVVAWRPSGELIASVRRNPEQDLLHEVVFFEKNGLKRYTFPLGVSKESEVIEIAWSCNSEILAVRLKDQIMLWTSKNYHWYLKQSIPSENVAWMKWHPERPYSLFLGLHDGSSIETHSFIWDTISGPLVGQDQGKILVIDGKKLKITPLKLANVPPPMALREITWLESDNALAPVHCAFNESNALCVLSREHVIIYSDDKESSIKSKWEHLCGPGVRQVAYVNGIVTVACRDKKLVQFDTDGKHIAELDISVYHIKPTVDYSKTVVQTPGGKVYLLENPPRLIGQLPARCVGFAVNNDESIFGLTETGKLYRNSTLISNSVTSFVVTLDLVIFTTSQHFLKLCHLQSDRVDVPADSSKGDERCRDIERGSLLISVIPSKNALTLQAPRGNLETIYPRILVLTQVRRYISEIRYDLAFSLCRIHRIDLNILHDYLPGQFFENLKLFVQQLGKTSYLDLFLSGLKDEDVSRTMYRETLELGGAATADDGHLEGKINRICKEIIPYLSQQSRLTAYACMSPPDLVSALQEVQAKPTAQERETAIQYLCFLQDIELIYRTALAMYNIEMTLLVAQQSQKDPKEYLAFLRDLRRQSEIRRQFTIDDHLGNNTKALDHLYTLAKNEEAESDEFIGYVVRQELYNRAQTLTRYDKILQPIVLEKYASYLYGKTNYVEAAMCYETLGFKEQALDAYVIGGAWRQALSIAPEDRLKSLSEHLIEVLTEQHHYKECAIIYSEYLKDQKNAVEMFCQGYAIHDAIRLADSRLLTSVVDPKLLELYGTMSELAVDCNQQIKSQISRLRELRNKKKEDPLAFFGGGDANTDIPDDVSIAATETTSASIFTRYTGKTGGTAQTGASRRTAKNKRREERKRARGKKGTVYEEEYLMKSIGRLVERLNDTQADARALLEGLYRREHRDHAHQLQQQFDIVIEEVEGVLDEVFSISEKDRERIDEDGEVYVLPEIAKPLLKPYPKLTILDFSS